MELDRRTVVAGALAISAAALVGLPAHASELNLGSSTAIKVGSSKVFTSGPNRILVYRQSTSKFFAYRANCPVDATSFAASNVKGARVTCPKDKLVFGLSNGKAIGKAGKSLESLPIRVSKGFLIATIAATATATPSPSPSESTKALISVDKVPLASGVRVSSSVGPLMILQPRQGVYLAYSAICTHAGCEVTDVSTTEMICTCHGSSFSTNDGAVLQGPARRGLAQYEVVNRDGMLFLQ
jgi:nitrite reductase/ring-hydroxylating ferredoxin subunit